MAIFTTKEILEAAELFRPTPRRFQGIVTGVMIGINLSEDKNALPNMVSAVIALAESNKSA